MSVFFTVPDRYDKTRTNRTPPIRLRVLVKFDCSEHTIKRINLFLQCTDLLYGDHHQWISTPAESNGDVNVTSVLF